MREDEMQRSMPKSNRRIAVVINYSCVILFLVFFYSGSYFGWSLPVVIGTVAAAVAVLTSFVLLHIRTRLWKLVHTKIEDLDERQVQVTHESLRQSYGIFSVLSLIVLMCIALLGGGRDSILMIIFAGLLYLAHTLPSSIIAWKEKEV